ncbi:hypothetical protein [Emticicia fluvialis]|uniref:hypothetical protein n=1 Tax=Emticicia fluvialis TaxID=2974474 RepID=UPI002165B25C|nr:hypothetical protein [Emticicia fluvialis]
MKKLLTVFFFLMSQIAYPQGNPPRADFKNPSLWLIYNKPTPIWKDTLQLDKTDNDGMMVLKDFEMTNGTIEFDVKGANLLQQSFVGVAFNVQDSQTYEHVYFRPFNFMNADTARRSRAVQYASLPDAPWFKLRDDFPGKYENKVKPVPDPDDWFHARVVVGRPFIRVYVNNHPAPCLEVKSLAPARPGKIAIWAGPATRAEFTNLVVTPTVNH